MTDLTLNFKLSKNIDDFIKNNNGESDPSQSIFDKYEHLKIKFSHDNRIAISNQLNLRIQDNDLQNLLNELNQDQKILQVNFFKNNNLIVQIGQNLFIYDPQQNQIQQISQNDTINTISLSSNNFVVVSCIDKLQIYDDKYQLSDLIEVENTSQGMHSPDLTSFIQCKNNEIYICDQLLNFIKKISFESNIIMNQTDCQYLSVIRPGLNCLIQDNEQNVIKELVDDVKDSYQYPNKLLAVKTSFDLNFYDKEFNKIQTLKDIINCVLNADGKIIVLENNTNDKKIRLNMQNTDDILELIKKQLQQKEEEKPKKNNLAINRGNLKAISLKKASLIDHTQENKREAYFAGGSFWIIQERFDKTFGNVEGFKTEAVYINSKGSFDEEVTTMTYKEVSYNNNGWVQGIKVMWDDFSIKYADLVEQFFDCIDWTQDDGQFTDVGPQFKTGIFYKTDVEAREARSEAQKRNRLFYPVVTEIRLQKEHIVAEQCHQQYQKRNAGIQQAQLKKSGRMYWAQRLQLRKDELYK